MKFGGAAAADWEAKYEAEDAPPTEEAAYEAQTFVQTLLRHLRPGLAVLDAGCGTGGLLWFLHRRGFAVAGVDASAAAVETARRAVPDADLRVASIEALPFPDASFDAYLAIGSWEYPEQGPDAAAREAARVLKPGGLAFVEVPQLSLLRRLLYVPLKHFEYWLRKDGKGSPYPRFSHHLFSFAEIRELLARHGFDVLEVHPHDLPERTRHYGLWVDWPFLRGGAHYELNVLGRLVKAVGNALSPWTISTGMFIVARKQ